MTRTKHNLDKHLAWLLSNVQLSRPVGPSLPNAHDAFDASRSFVSVSSQPSAGDLTKRPPVPTPDASSSSTATTRSEIDLTLDDDSFAGTHSGRNIAAALRPEEGMARLNTKATKKPSLVSKQEQLPTPTPSTTGGSRLHQAYTASLTKDDAQDAPLSTKRPISGATSSSISRPPRPAPRGLTPEIPEEEFHDLTREDTTDPDVTDSTAATFGEPVLLWTEEHALRPEPLPTPRGRKRKSSEMTRATPRSKEEPKAEDDEYPDIVDFLDEDMMTPAMAKRRTAGLASVRRSPPKLHLAASDTTLLMQRTANQAASRTDTVTHHMPASMGSTPRQSGTRDTFKVESPSKRREGHLSEGERLSPSPGPIRQRRRGNVVMDSDDEFQTPPICDVSDVPFTTATAGSGSKRKLSPRRQIDEDANKPAAETLSKQRPVSPTIDGFRAKQSPEEMGHFEEMELDDPEEKLKPGSAEVERDIHSSETDGTTFIMDLFLEKPHILDGLTKALNEKLARNSADFARSLREKWPVERKAQVKKEKAPLLNEKKALSDVKAAHEAYKHLMAQKEELVTQIGMAYDADEDTTELEAGVEELDKELEQTERGLKEALMAAGINKPDMFHDLPDPPPQQPEQLSPAVKSTQPTPARPPPSSKESIVIPECTTQVIMQTQAPSRQQSRVVSLEQPPDATKPAVPLFARDTLQSSRTLGSNIFSKPLSRPSQDNKYMEDMFDDDEELWAQPEDPHPKPRVISTSRVAASAKSRSPARPKPCRLENLSDYGDGDDDLAAMVAMAEEAEDFEQRQPSPEPRSHTRARSILSEASGNAGSTARVKITSKKPVKQVPKLKIPPELMKHPWSNDVLRAFKDRFRLEGFRHNQLEAINATLAGRDAFVLMPTGGGKSLCYQLPAVINSGKTRGVTIVVTPLLSLMQDQVDHLIARGIVAKAFNGDMDRREKDDILQSFKLRNPEHHVQLLYVTPEMINKSTAFINGLMTLYRNKKLARLVIDEAHCVSQWGHDFRPDYKMLGEVRARFPGVPVMALTATATNNVIADIEHNLGLEDFSMFTQSFNRPNLYYEIRPKEKQPVDRIAELINERYHGKTGIVYTLSRKQTEQIAKKLREHGVRADHYHAALQTEDKTRVQRDWQTGKIKVVVATIAFGMGIDKPDVRFVIHHYLPKSLEGYYQETGRAGRDGLPSDCILFFGHGDIHSLRKMIVDGDGNRQQKDRQKEMLNRVVMFCENSRDCRRSQLLHYFGESFPRDKCNKTCDNCKIGGVFDVEDRTMYAKAVLEAVMYHTRLTMNQCTDILRGTKKPDEHEEPQSFHGIARHLKKPEVNSVIIRLAAEGALDEENKIGGAGIAIQYFILGREAASFLSGGRKLEVVVRTGGDKSAPAKVTKKATRKKAVTEDTEEFSRPVSTLVSSPIRHAARKNKKGKAIASYFDEEAIVEGDEDDDLEPSGAMHPNGYENDGFVVPDEDEDDYFEPVRPAPRQRRQRTLDELGPPISRAPEEAAIDDIHNDIVAAFLEEAKRLEEDLRNMKGLRRVLFTEAQLQQMAIKWTTTVDRMRHIPGINRDNVDKFGVKFIPLVMRFHGTYREMMGNGEDAMATIPATAGPLNTRRGQPQHNDIVDLVSDDEDDDDYEEPGIPSKYFGANTHEDPIQSQLENWNARFSRTTQAEQSEPVPRGRGSSRKGSQGGKRNHYRKGGGSSRAGSRYSGVSKRKASTSAGSGSVKRAGAGSSKSGGSKSTVRPGGGGRSGGGSGIGLMPF
ncbi:ATP-dependent DNA helicase hus2/rqh1 [Cytospora mali]|uniref:DNA 3'-5' helicase n=1 Tax=Cytospora mali TaxID=578113 RepID=A0A194VRK1_CYTMA|nr:ATP-dependent DNA helicase hus2/rqh1 [Valsa mali]